MGGSFYLGGLVQGRRPYVIWVSEGLKRIMDQVKESLSQITAQDEIVKEIFHWRGTCLRDKTNKARKCACSGLVLHNINDYPPIYI
jgi:hypothetical protein